MKLPPHEGREDKSKYKITEEQSGNTLLVPFFVLSFTGFGGYFVCVGVWEWLGS